MSSFLQQNKRQPKLFIDLPSKGKFYDDTVLEGGQYNQIPVFGMNAMDEIMFKTPDALFTGEATAQVIRSCIPTILNPTKLVGFDIDYVLIAIRIATYGDDLEIVTSCPHCDSENENVLSMTKMIQSYDEYSVEYNFNLDDLTFNLKPITYNQMTEFSVQQYALERQMYQINQAELKDEEKNKQITELYTQMSQLNLEVAISYISYISNGADTETDVNAIKEFIIDNDAEFYNNLKNGINDLSNRWKIPKVDVVCANEECGKSYNSAIELDYSNFFGLKFLHSRNLIS